MLKFNKITTIVSSLLATIFIVLSTIFITKYSLLEKHIKNDQIIALKIDVKFEGYEKHNDESFFVITKELTIKNSLYDGIVSKAFTDSNPTANFVWSGPSAFGYMLTSIDGVGPSDSSDHHFWQIKSSTSKDVDENGVAQLGASSLLLDYVNVFEFDYVTW